MNAKDQHITTCKCKCGWCCAALLGDNVLYILEMAKRNILQSNARVIPAAATLYCVGIEALTQPVHDFDFGSLDKYR